MITISFKNGTATLRTCGFCGGKVHNRQPETHIVSRPYHFVRPYRNRKPISISPYRRPRFYSTKVIRGISNGNMCQISYGNTTTKHSKAVLNGENYLSKSVVAYLTHAMKTAATAGGTKFLYITQNWQLPGAIHTSSPAANKEGSQHSGKSTVTYTEQNAVWESIKVSISSIRVDSI